MTAHATTENDGSAIVTLDGNPRKVIGTDLDDARRKVATLVAEHAAATGSPIDFITTEPAGTWEMIVYPDGRIEPKPEEAPQPVAPQYEAPPQHAAAPAPQQPAAPAPEHPAPPAYTSRREQRTSFLKTTRPEEPAQKGWRGTATRMGLRLAPGPGERAERDDTFAVSQHWPGPRTIAVVNGKGGAGKTPTTVLLSAIFARFGGAGVLAWDANQTRGTLGWRTEQGPHQSTVLDLLPAAHELLGTGAQSADLARYVHHQTADRFDVLRSQPLALASEQRLSADDVDAAWNVARKYYRLVFIDTGNDESDATWGRLVDHSDQIVVATTTRDDHAEAGALLLEALADRSESSARLAQQAVVVVSQADPRATAADIKTVADGFRSLAREVATIPHDPEMVDGWLNVAALRPATQRAWLGAAAAVARGL